MKGKDICRLLILTAMLISVLSIAHARPLTETFGDGLIKINDFFEQEKYKPYAKAIDFGFFFLLFTSIYLIGVKYAFREVDKPVKAIAVVLGFMSAFLMVANDYSIISLLPYLPLFLYLFLFILLWLLLKGMKSKLWRFIIALLITLLIAAIVEGWLFEVEELALSFFALPKNEKK